MKYPETKVVYATEAGRLRKAFLAELLRGLCGSLLDLGCNNYTYEPYWRGFYVGVDIARQVLHSYHRSGVQGDACLLPFKDGLFNYVLICEMIEHLATVDQRIQCLREVHRVLAEGGEALVTVPMGMAHRGPDSRVWFPILEKYGVNPYKYVHGHYNVTEMEKLTDKSGFKIAETKHLWTVGDNHTFFRLKKV